MNNLTASVIDINEVRRKKEPSLSALSNAQYFVRELIDRYAFSMKELAEHSRISERTLGRFYNLETRQSTRKTFCLLLSFYCAVIHGGIRPLQTCQMSTVQVPDSRSADYYFIIG